MSSYDNLLVNDDAGVRVMTLNRPEKKNAVSPGLAEDLSDALRQATEDDEIRVVMVHGAGDAYCAGADLRPPRCSTACAPSPATWRGCLRAPWPRANG